MTSEGGKASGVSAMYIREYVKGVRIRRLYSGEDKNREVGGMEGS